MLSPSPITGVGSISIDDTSVIAGSYTYASFDVNAQGQLTNATSNPVPAISNLSDTVITSPTINDVLTFNGTDWVNQTIPNDSLASLTDVALVGLSNNDII